MTNHRTQVLRTLFLSLMLIFSACSKKVADNAATGLLGYIPSDTPYVFVTTEKLPDDLYNKLEPRLDDVFAAYRKLLHVLVEQANAEMQQDALAGEDLQKLSKIVAELDSLLSLEGMESAGIDRNSRFALYGNGLLPVMRMTLSDGALLEETIAKIEASAGQNLDTTELDGHKLRYVDDREWRFVLGIIDDQLVMSAAPLSLDDDDMRKLLGLSLPAANIAASGRLAEIREKYNFENFLTGLIDIERIAATFLDAPTGLDAAMLEAAEFDLPELDDVCREEIRSIAGIMPRIVTGYTTLTADELGSKFIMELRDDIASGLTAIAGEVPGLGQRRDGLLSFGLSFDLLAMREFYSTRLDAMEADPYECVLLADLQDGVAGGRELLNQPIPPVAYSFNGFLAVVHELTGMDLQNDVPPESVDMQMLVATDNAQGLLAMGAMFSPDIAALQLEPGGDPVELALPQLAQLGQTAYVAMAENALAVSVGDGMETSLQDLLAAPAARPLQSFSVEMDAARYYEFIAAGVDADGDMDLDDMPELREAIQELMVIPAELFERFKIDMAFTMNGVEFDSSVTLKD